MTPHTSHTGGEKIICWFKGHIWREWAHNSDKPRREFFSGTVLLKRPDCIRCGLTKEGVAFTRQPQPHEY